MNIKKYFSTHRRKIPDKTNLSYLNKKNKDLEKYKIFILFYLLKFKLILLFKKIGYIVKSKKGCIKLYSYLYGQTIGGEKNYG